jgi:hypothetical protein
MRFQFVRRTNEWRRRRRKTTEFQVNFFFILSFFLSDGEKKKKFSSIDSNVNLEAIQQEDRERWRNYFSKAIFIFDYLASRNTSRSSVSKKALESILPEHRRRSDQRGDHADETRSEVRGRDFFISSMMKLHSF